MKKFKNTIKNSFVGKLFYYLFSFSSWCYEEEMHKQFRSKYNIDPSFYFNGGGAGFNGEGKIICGKNSYIGQYSSIQSSANCKVVIGDNCSISHFVKIYTQNSLADQDFSKEKKYSMGDVIIGNDCWIGANVFIRENVEIGGNAVIGANSMVAKNIPPHSIAVGNPAKVIKFKSYLTKLEKEKLALEFWDSLSDKLKLEFSYLKNNQ